MTTELTTLDLLDALAGAGLPDRATARRIVDATLAVLGERLTSDESAALCACLAPGPRGILAESSFDASFDAAELYERVRKRAGVSAGLAREQAQVVVQTIGRAAPAGTVRRLARALPPELASLFEPQEAPEVPPPAVAAGTSLATGRPGSRHPVSESAPSRAQQHSVVREDNPHGDTKISSGRPGPTRPIAEGWRQS
jgi:uncharacterized protein (DUF2267 family)